MADDRTPISPEKLKQVLDRLNDVLAEAALLATGGVIGGLIIGGAMVYLATVKGFYIGNFGITGALFEDRIYAHFTWGNTINRLRCSEELCRSCETNVSNISGSAPPMSYR